VPLKPGVGDNLCDCQNAQNEPRRTQLKCPRALLLLELSQMIFEIGGTCKENNRLNPIISKRCFRLIVVFERQKKGFSF